MIKNIIGIIVSYIFVFAVIISAKLIEKKGKEASRKYIHITLSFWWVIALAFFDNIWFAIIPPITFVILNYISVKKDLIKVMEREEEKKDGYGTVYYALSLLILIILTFIINKPELGLVGVFTMGFGDGFAAIVGKKVKSKQYKIGNTTKTIAGSLTMFIITLIITAIFMAFYGVNMWIIKSILIATIMTIIEAVSIKGTDNITVPLISCLLTFLVM